MEKNSYLCDVLAINAVMTKTINPFIVSGKIPNDYFCDRQEEASLLIRYLTSQENVVLMSQRRMGKTKLVEHCFDNKEWGCDYILIMPSVRSRQP